MSRLWLTSSLTPFSLSLGRAQVDRGHLAACVGSTRVEMLTSMALVRQAIRELAFLWMMNYLIFFDEARFVYAAETGAGFFVGFGLRNFNSRPLSGIIYARPYVAC